jgi:hypothetical protein
MADMNRAIGAAKSDAEREKLIARLAAALKQPA